MRNASRPGRLQFQLSGGTPCVSVQIRAAVLELEMRLDTVIVEPDEERLVLVWRGRQNVHGKIHDVHGVRIGYGSL